jgi:hypothetical protein
MHSQRIVCVMTSTTIHALVEGDGLDGVNQLLLGVVSSSMIPKLLTFVECLVTQ